MKRKIQIAEPKWLLVTAFFIAGIFLGGLGIYLYFGVQGAIGVKIHPTKNSYKYINPLLAVDLFETKQFAANKSFELQLAGLVSREKQKGTITNASVYFRDIEPGIWSGVGESEKFSPGRIMKIPLMIAYYKLAENDPKILTDTVFFNGNYAPVASLLPQAGVLTAGESYTVGDLIRRMIVFSDDTATNLLYDHINHDILGEVFTDLGVESLSAISLKSYSLFFRVLYNSTYLNREYSEKALTLLVEADNTVGLGAGIPKELPVANRTNAKLLPNGQVEMADCGIIYYPQHPYIICARVDGKSLNKVETVLKNIGEIAEEAMSYRYH